MRGNRRFLLSAASESAVRFVSGLPKSLSEGLTGDAPQSWVTLTRTGDFTDPRYGKFSITRTMLEEMVRNFNANSYGQKIFIDLSHKPEDGAAAEIIKLTIEGDRLRALAAWTPMGVNAVKVKGFRYLSAEFHENWRDNETGDPHGCVLLGAGLVIRPCIKRLDPVQLSELGNAGEGAAVLLHPTLLSEIMNEAKSIMNKYLKQLREHLEGLKLSEAAITSILATAEKSMQGTTDDKELSELCDSFIAVGKTLSEQPSPAGQVNLTVGLSESQIDQMVAKKLAEHATASKQLAEQGTAKVKRLSDAIAAKIPDAAIAKQLSEPLSAVVINMDDVQIDSLAQQQIALGEQLLAAKKLSEQGFNFSGSARIQVPDEGATKLSGMIRDALKLTDAYSNGTLKLPEKDSPFVAKVLSAFDAQHAHKLHAEHKMLSGGDATTGDYYNPAAVQREVIRVALSDLNVLGLVRTSVDPSATSTTEIPYEVRSAFNAVNDGVVYEGQAIPRSQNGTAYETAFITPMKIGAEWTNELAHFTRVGLVNWDAIAENIRANARTMQELTARRIANELQRAGDSYGAVAVVGENIAAQLNGSTSIIKTSNFPVVRPFQAKNLQGVAQGSAENPIALVVNNTAISMWDGTGKQAAGTYWRPVSYNLGQFQLVDKDGNPLTPTAATACTIGYSRATNVIKVDIDIPNGVEKAKHLNKILEYVGSRKAMLSGQRYVSADFMLMSPTLNDLATNAEAFVESAKRNGTDTNAMGDLATIKGLPAFGTNQPGIDLGDERILIAPRNLLGYTVAKPFSISGQPFEVVDANGNAIGKKQVYGEEYNAIHVPTAVRGYITSVLCYSANGR